jgi:DNA replicative helicase MCM subunit Mcm2 (Cdc46/Mcm family)
MRYKAFYLCDVCGHKWETYYSRQKLIEQGDICENCLYRPSYNKDFKGVVVEPYFFKKVVR